MKISKSRLRQIISEEIKRSLLKEEKIDLGNVNFAETFPLIQEYIVGPIQCDIYECDARTGKVDWPVKHKNESLVFEIPDEVWQNGFGSNPEKYPSDLVIRIEPNPDYLSLELNDPRLGLVGKYSEALDELKKLAVAMKESGFSEFSLALARNVEIDYGDISF